MGFRASRRADVGLCVSYVYVRVIKRVRVMWLFAFLLQFMIWPAIRHVEFMIAVIFISVNTPERVFCFRDRSIKSY